MPFQLEDRNTDGKGDHCRHANGNYTGGPGGHHQQWFPVDILPGYQHTEVSQTVNHRICLQADQVMGSQSRRQIATNGKKTGMAKGDLARIPHDHGQTYHQQGIIGRHGELGQIILGPGDRGQRLDSDHQSNQKRNFKKF